MTRKATEDRTLRIVSNYGILGKVLPDSQFSTIYPYWDETFPSYTHFSRKYGMAPICLIERLEKYGKDIFAFANVSESNVFYSTLDKLVELDNIAVSLERWNLPATFMATFYLGASYHHLCSIVEAYIEIASDFSHLLTIRPDKQLQEKESLLPNSKWPIKWVQDLPTSKVGVTNFSSRDVNVIFYEMMAYLTSARSLLDSLLIHVLKPRPSIVLPKAVRMKPSFQKLLNNIQNCKMPDDLKDFITKIGLGLPS